MFGSFSALGSDPDHSLETVLTSSQLWEEILRTLETTGAF